MDLQLYVYEFYNSHNKIENNTTDDNDKSGLKTYKIRANV